MSQNYCKPYAELQVDFFRQGTILRYTGTGALGLLVFAEQRLVCFGACRSGQLYHDHNLFDRIVFNRWIVTDGSE